MKITIDPAKCIHCKECVNACEWEVFEEVGENIEVANLGMTDEQNCGECMECVENCPVQAIEINFKE